jgi:hypothetical protein
MSRRIIAGIVLCAVVMGAAAFLKYLRPYGILTGPPPTAPR